MEKIKVNKIKLKKHDIERIFNSSVLSSFFYLRLLSSFFYLRPYNKVYAVFESNFNEYAHDGYLIKTHKIHEFEILDDIFMKDFLKIKGKLLSIMNVYDNDKKESYYLIEYEDYKKKDRVN